MTSDFVPPMYQNDATGRNLRVAGGVVDGEPAVAVEVRTHDTGSYRTLVTLWFDATCLDELMSAAHNVLREATAREAVRQATT